MLALKPFQRPIWIVNGTIHLRLAFEVLHDIKKSIVDIGLVRKLDFDLIKVTKGILW